MSIVYEKASDGAHEIIAKATHKFHPHLEECGAKIECLTATRVGADGEKVGGSAVKVNGYPCAAKVKINSLADRTEGKMDATITIDSEQWEEMTPDERVALVDHELQHLDVMREDEKGAVLRDDQDRPRLKLRKHDHQFGWFNAVAERHSDASFEVKQAKHFFDEHGQGWLGILPFNAGRPPESLAEKAAQSLGDKKGDKPNGNGHGKMPKFVTNFAKRIRDAIRAAGFDNEASADFLVCNLSGGNCAHLNADQLRASGKTAVTDWTKKLEEAGPDYVVNLLKSSGVGAAA
jgi:hypothetical protein